jgi:hypothetical protein
MLFWGVGFLLGALDVPSYAGNLSDLHLFGSTTPVTIDIYMVWFCLAALVLAAVTWLRWRLAGRWANWGLARCTMSEGAGSPLQRQSGTRGREALEWVF